MCVDIMQMELAFKAFGYCLGISLQGYWIVTYQPYFYFSINPLYNSPFVLDSPL